MGLFYLLIINFLFLYVIIFKLNNNFNIINVSKYSHFYPYLSITIIHLIYFLFYFFSDIQLWIYGNTINAFADATSFINQSNDYKFFENIHNVIESKLGGHEYINKSMQLEVLKASFSDSFYPISYNEDPESGFIFFFIIIKFLFRYFSLMHFSIFFFILSILSLCSIYKSICFLFDQKTSLIFLILLFFYIPYFNVIIGLYHHFLIVPAFAIYLIFLEFSLKKKYSFFLMLFLSLILSLLIISRSSLIIFIPSILISSLLFKNNFLYFLKLLLILCFSFFLILNLTINSNYNKNKDGIKYGSHVFWYTFFTGLGETQEIITSADDGIGFNLVSNNRPDLIPMTKEWDSFFKVNSFNLINDNKSKYLKLIYYRINKVYLNISNWNIFTINSFNFNVISYFYNFIYLISLIFFLYIFLINKFIFYRILLFSIPIIINSNLTVSIFSKNFYYFFSHSFIYFIIFSSFFSLKSPLIFFKFLKINK